MTQYVRNDSRSKKAQQVATILEALTASSEPVPFDDLCASAGVKYPQDIEAAMHALELVGVLEKYTYAETGSTRKRKAYKVAEGVDVANPT